MKPYISFLHYIFGFRRKPLTPERAREILKKSYLYNEIAPYYTKRS